MSRGRAPNQPSEKVRRESRAQENTATFPGLSTPTDTLSCPHTTAPPGSSRA